MSEELEKVREEFARIWHRHYYDYIEHQEVVPHYDSLSPEGKNFYRKKADWFLQVQIGDKPCPKCKGRGWFKKYTEGFSYSGHYDYPRPYPSSSVDRVDCPTCQGKGKVVGLPLGELIEVKK